MQPLSLQFSVDAGNSNVLAKKLIKKICCRFVVQDVEFVVCSRTKAELLCYYRTEQDPLCVSFSQVQNNLIHSVEQKVSRKVRHSKTFVKFKKKFAIKNNTVRSHLENLLKQIISVPLGIGSGMRNYFTVFESKYWFFTNFICN